MGISEGQTDECSVEFFGNLGEIKADKGTITASDTIIARVTPEVVNSDEAITCIVSLKSDPNVKKADPIRISVQPAA